ncbi:MAG: ABC transporter permease [Sciscionella sp.]
MSAAALIAGFEPALPAGGPVIPNFGGSSCTPDQTFCWSWVQQHWGDTLAPALVQHIYITLIAVACGLVITLTAALFAYRYRWFEQTFTVFSTFLYTIPSLAFFLLFLPLTGITLTTIEIGLTGYTFLLLFRNILTGLQSVPPEAVAAATGMGMTRRQVLFRINLPLAIPSIMAGLRISSVTAISLATIAADVTPLGLGAPIFYALHTTFTTELIAAGVLAILLALVADVLLVLLRRAITPWIRARTKGVG